MEDWAPVQDDSVEQVSQNHKQHIPVERNEGQAQVAEGEKEAEMVTRRKLTVDRFLSSTQSLAQPQQTRSKDHNPPFPQTGCQIKKQRTNHIGS